MHRRFFHLLGAFSLVTTVVLGASAPSAQAVVVANQFNVTPTTMTAGGSVSIAASFHIAPPPRHAQVVYIDFTSPTTGTVTPTVDSFSGFFSCSTVAAGVVCHFPSGSGNGVVGNVNLTVSSSPDASGSFAVTASYSDSHTAKTQIAGPTTVTISPPPADLVLAKSADVSTVVPGQTVTYTLDYENQGQADAANVELQDTLPAGITLTTVDTSGSTHFGAGDCTGTMVVVCSTASVPSGETGSIELVATVDATVAPGDVLTNDASIVTTTTESDLTNNFDSVDLTVSPFADLEVSKSSPTPVHAGDEFTYTITYENHGPSDAQDVVVADTLPPEVSLVSVTPDQGSCTGTSCDLGTVANGASGQITIVVDTDPTFAGTVDNTVTISAATFDTDTTNNTAQFQTSVTASADLSVTKSAPATAFVGDTFDYSISWENHGPSAATNVQVGDLLPPLVSYVSDDGGCSEAGGLVSCDLGTVAPGASGTIVITVTAVAPGNAFNRALITHGTPDPDGTNNESDTTTTIAASADVSVSKSGPASATVGEAFDYIVSYTNDGPSAAADVVITDTLPSEVSYVSDDSGCSETSGVVTCTIGTVAAGGGGTITISVIADMDGTAVNTADVTASTHDPDIANNTDDATTTIAQPTIDLEMTKTAPANVYLGQAFEFDLAYENHGPFTATGVTLTDSFPSAFTITGITPPAGVLCTYDNTLHTIDCSIGTLAAGESGTVIVEAVADVVGPVTNTASVSGTETDTNLLNNTDTADTFVFPAVDLEVTKSAPSDVFVGGVFDYVIAFENHGPSTATAVLLVDTLPSGVSYVSDDSGCSLLVDSVICSLGSIGVGASGAVTITVSADTVGDVTNTADISAAENDTDPLNDSDTAETTINPVVDLEVGKIAPTDVLVGGAFEYDVFYENHGPSDATNVVVTDTLPAGVAYLFATPNAGSCSEAAGVVTCNIGTVTAGGSGSILIAVTADTPGVATNIATVTSSETDIDPSNNTATFDTTINPVADLSVTKSASTDTVAPGDDLTYTITYANAGPSTASDVEVADTLPAGVTFVSATPDTGSCVEAGGVVTCAVGDVTAGTIGSVVIVVSIPAGTPDGSLSNQASVSSPTSDPDPDNNAAIASVTVSADGGLPVTGADSKDLTAFALALLFAGSLMLLFRRANLRRARG